MSEKTLPGIYKIEYLPASELVIYPKQILSAGAIVSAIGNFVELPLIGLASCITTSERTPAGLIYNTTITGSIIEGDEASLTLQNQLTEQYHIYRITDIYKEIYLVGCDKSPYPEVQFSNANESSPDGMRVINLEISYISTIPPIEIVSV